MSVRQLIFAAFLLLAVTVVEASDQSIWIKGILTCKGQLAAGVTVEIWDHDTLDPDDLMGTNSTVTDGSFNITGWTESKSTIDPYTKFIHNCTENNDQACSKKVVPDKYINEGREPTKAYDFYSIELNSLSDDC
ncbi:Transthyretin-like family protein [Aphelenchoides bicaudatus]|nr:Transthyretin-like family protein [Aphelenchoides bicaudatus]